MRRKNAALFLSRNCREKPFASLLPLDLGLRLETPRMFEKFRFLRNHARWSGGVDVAPYGFELVPAPGGFGRLRKNDGNSDHSALEVIKSVDLCRRCQKRLSDILAEGGESSFLRRQMGVVVKVQDDSDGSYSHLSVRVSATRLRRQDEARRGRELGNPSEGERRWVRAYRRGIPFRSSDYRSRGSE